MLRGLAHFVRGWWALLFRGKVFWHSRRYGSDKIAAAAEQARPVAFAAGAVIFREGDLAHHMYMITRGQVEVTRHNGHGGQEALMRLTEGQFFGAIGALSVGRRTATVTALTPVEGLALDLELVKGLLAASPSAADTDRILRRKLIRLGMIYGRPSAMPPGLARTPCSKRR